MPGWLQALECRHLLVGFDPQARRQGTCRTCGGGTFPESLPRHGSEAPGELWGRLRRLSEADRAELLASEEARHAVVMTLIGDVPSAYLQLRQLDLELETTRRNVASRRDSLQLARERFDSGLTSELDLRQAEAEEANPA